MSSGAIGQENWQVRPGPKRVAWKVWREIARPFRPRKVELPDAPQAISIAEAIVEAVPATAPEPTAAPTPPYLTGKGAEVVGFHPHQATVEVEGIEFVRRLVRQSRQYPGPIVEIGTLLGVTTTNMALAKAAYQKIVTVDLYCWNPWGFSPDAHEALADQVLRYLISTGHVERLRMDKNEFFAGYRGPTPSMVFLDAIHDYEETKKDIEWARRVEAPIIAGHDYCEEFPGVMQAVDEFGGPRELGASVWQL